MNSTIQRISFIGSGNVASHLGKALSDKGIEISVIISRNLETSGELARELDTTFSNDLNILPEKDIVLLCVPDDEISDILNKIPTDIRVAYTSGSVDINSLPLRNKLGVFYPLQSFSKGSTLEYSTIPFFIESTSESFENELCDLARVISSKVKVADSAYRRNLHLAAVWVNNFTNHILHNAVLICDQHNVDFNELRPLLAETISKLTKQTPYDAQTGPARRNDTAIIEQQLSKLSGDQKEIYKAITDSIINTYRND